MADVGGFSLPLTKVGTRGVYAGVAGTTIAVLVTWAQPSVIHHGSIILATIAAFAVGIPLSRVPLTAVPQRTALSHAFGGVAESGTLMLVSGADNPTTLNFLPDTHIVVVDANDIAGDDETVRQRVRKTFGVAALPSAINMITGPSRSADIGQILILGAHGPRRLHVLVVGETS